MGMALRTQMGTSIAISGIAFQGVKQYTSISRIDAWLTWSDRASWRWMGIQKVYFLLHPTIWAWFILRLITGQCRVRGTETILKNARFIFENAILTKCLNLTSHCSHVINFNFFAPCFAYETFKFWLLVERHLSCKSSTDGISTSFKRCTWRDEAHVPEQSALW